jgi:hypothetical protein
MSRSLMAFVMVIVCATAFAATRSADLSGTWVGVTQVPNVGEDAIKLELKADGSSYSGVMSDSAGMVAPAPVTNLKLEGSALTFDISVNNGEATFPAHITLKADGDTLVGSWATDAGDSAPLTLARQK